MDKIVERAAKAAYESRRQNPRGMGCFDRPWEELTPGEQSIEIEAQRAAIEEMLEPTDEMRVQGVEALGKRKRQLAKQHFRGAGQEREFATMLLSDASMTDPVWRAMIVAALRD